MKNNVPIFFNIFFRWHGHMVLNLAAMFKDITMTPDQLQFVIEKILRLLNEIDLQELPPLIYQLLVLSTNVSKLQVFLEILRVYIHLVYLLTYMVQPNFLHK